jgi:methyl-accepting chemotaxis protein
MIISWRKIVAQLIEGATNLSSSSAEIAASSEQTAQGAESQMEQIVKTSAGMEEMSVSIQEVSENAMATSKEAEDSSLRARESAGKIKESIEGILESGKSIAQLNERVQEVGKVVEIIGGIALQTNILSLNAAIEAARAGEQGKGFEVVAGEIRNLALDTTESTAEIREILEEIQKETGRAVNTIESGTAKTGMVGESLDIILEGLLATTEKVQVISSLAVEQSKTAEEIAESLQKISQVSQDSAGSSIETRNAITELVELAERLKGITDLFKLEEAASTVNEYHEGQE